MKTRAIACLVAAVTMSIGSMSLAQARDGRSDRGDDRQAQQRNENRPGNGRPDGRNDGNGRDGRGDDRGDQRADRSHPYDYTARGNDWRRGRHVPQEYRNRTYRVDDWRGHRLSQPPHGHQWVQVGSDYVLMAVATGLIVQLLINQ